ncbi:putative enoyl CoA hydratase [Cladochytrium tenue]|nr:putative enoyl CoA hydratase [Cladochytrium tenue]
MVVDTTSTRLPPFTPVLSFLVLDETLALSFLEDAHVLVVDLNRPKALNAMNKAFWREFRQLFDTLATTSAGGALDVRAVVVTGGTARGFTAGLDLTDMGDDITLSGDGGVDPARASLKFLPMVDTMQDTFSSMERCWQPVVAAVHGFCIGGGIDLITACDVRLCSGDAYFSVKEVDIGIAADVGTLQRLPKVVGNQSWVRDVCFTARRFGADEARSVGLVSGAPLPPGPDAVRAEAIKLASLMATKSPVAVAGTKRVLMHTRDHSVADGLAYVGLWNSAMLRTQDTGAAIQASLAKKTPTFSKL